ncbi:hypothetical protein [Methylobacterium sp. E-066]|uniref:hypothetical protein n=1 Tax=Methylobacterium sp. E-066 TaxID=2836584 RepID=UPI001FBBAA2D|nr:hypothetical protein [Methylobacterium sp. E-066]MCJ2144308.1 hypothetical protein [Methylobacterium sp. E-066]
MTELGGDLDPQRQSLGYLIHRYLVRTRRLIPIAKRHVFFVRRFWDSGLVTRHLNKVFELARLVEEGADLTPYLSGRAHRPGKHPRDDQHDGDFALAAYDVHHLHFDPVDPAGPRKVRQQDKEDVLLFATFDRELAAFIMVGTHKSFYDGTLESAVVQARADAGHMVLNGIKGESGFTALQRTRMGLRGLNTAVAIGGQAVISSMLMGNGSSMRTLRMADFAAWRIEDVDPILDDIERARALLGPRVPDDPDFSWGFDQTRLVLVEAKSRTGFNFADQPN